MKINVNYVIKCMKNKEYDNAVEYLDYVMEHDDTRLARQLVKIVASTSRIEKFTKYDYPECEYKNPREKFISRFYEALKYKDFKEASILADMCIDYFKEHDRDYDEMLAYKEILVYATDVQQQVCTKSNNITKLNSLTNALENYVRNTKEIQHDDLFELLDVIEEIIDLSYETGRSSNKMKYASEIIYTIIDFSDGVYRDKTYFGKEANYMDVYGNLNTLYAELEVGDYNSAYNSVKKYLNTTKKVNWIYILYYRLLKHLHSIISTYNRENSIDAIDFTDMYNKTIKDKNINDADLLANLVLVRTLKTK